jgi:hypothetical protein
MLVSGCSMTHGVEARAGWHRRMTGWVRRPGLTRLSPGRVPPYLGLPGEVAGPRAVAAGLTWASRG